MKEEIILKPIGVIHTPYKYDKGMPIQGTFEKDTIGLIEVFPEYRQGLKDIEGFSHLILIYYFNRAQEEKTVAKPFLEDESHGVFATRSPLRPNHIGISIVKLEKIEENVIAFSQVDMLDRTPLLDIKPYVVHFDSRDDIKNGWIEKHFKSGNIPLRVRQE
ncbi:MAG: tRNA (N6-threonylcarbamoyladenosine(37)-N6)-methyltransferase TrmO [Candidatus Omnitrophica bacterium]|nr:tRNA (N6-threonylcarbamoyladenosine(37)-N6)-methyltransferase TrmO [Candidatus Omnitrophota bacterium]